MSYFIKKGKSLTTRKGLLGPGTEILPEYIGDKGATARLDHLVEKDVLEKRDDIVVAPAKAVAEKTDAPAGGAVPLTPAQKAAATRARKKAEKEAAEAALLNGDADADADADDES